MLNDFRRIFVLKKIENKILILDVISISCLFVSILIKTNSKLTNGDVSTCFIMHSYASKGEYLIF